MCGMLAGSFVFGILGDYLGRWWALLLAILLACGAGAVGAIADNYWWYAFTRFLAGTGKVLLQLNFFLPVNTLYVQGFTLELIFLFVCLFFCRPCRLGRANKKNCNRKHLLM